VFTFVEAPLFTKLVGESLTDGEYAALQQALSRNPELGDLIRGSGGVRKVRWGTRGRGKRGGVRVVYFVRKEPGVIWMLTIYAKNVAENIPVHVLRRIRKEIEDA
jgi:mRNA-degrading endonuclease RelE of RelBE toxin-antitoxin system